MLRAVTVPFAVGAVLFLAAVVGAVVLVVLQPHTPELSGGEAAAGAWEEAGAGNGEVLEPESSDEQPPAGAQPATVLVHVVGEVHAPGVVELAEGARVHEAIAAAGGATEAAVLAGVNLARPLNDGEQVVVPSAQTLAGVVADGGSAGPGDPGVVDLNRADTTALETLPGVGPALAQRIIDWRSANGGFSSVEQLLEVSGIGPRTLEQLRAQVRV